MTVVLLAGFSPPSTGVDDLSRGRSHPAAIITTGSESDVFDGDRFARCVCDSVDSVDFRIPVIRVFIRFAQVKNRSSANHRKLHQLNEVFLI